MYQNQVPNFNAMNNAMNQQFNETFSPNRNAGLIRSASTSNAVMNNSPNQPCVPPRRRKYGQSLSSDKFGSANSSQYSLVMNYAYNEIDPKMTNQNTIKQNTWTPNSTLRRYMSSDMATNYNQYNMNNNLINNFNQQKPIGVLEQVMNRTIPTPPPRISSAKNTLRRRSYVENIMSTFEPPVKPIRQKIQFGLNQSEFDIPGTPLTTHLPPQTKSNRFTNRPTTTLSSINLSQTGNLFQQSTTNNFSNKQFNQPNAQSTSKNNLNQLNTNNSDYQSQPFYNKTMSLDNLHAATLKQNLRRSPTREELFDYIVAQQEQLSELKTQQKVLEKQVDIAHKEATKAHLHHHHHRRHKHHKLNRSKEHDHNFDNSIDSSSMISSERKSRSHHHRTKLDKNLTAEANRQVHDHIKQLQEQLELIRQKRRKIRTDKNDSELDRIDQALDKSIDSSLLNTLKADLTKNLEIEKNKIQNSKDRQETKSDLLKPPSKQGRIEDKGTKEDSSNNLNSNDLHNNLLSPIPTPLSSNRSPLGSRSSSIERAIAKRELLRESAKEKWNRSFMEDLADEQLIKELNRSSANQDILKELLPKISINLDDKNKDIMKYNEILEKNLKLNQAQNWLTDHLDEYNYSESKSPNEQLSPFGGRTGVFRPISADNSSVLSPNTSDLLTGTTNFKFPNSDNNFGIDRKETSSPLPVNYFENNIEGHINKKENNLITGNADLIEKRPDFNQMNNNISNLINNQNDLINNNMMINREQELNSLKKHEDKLIEKLETELMNEKLKQQELLNKKHEIEQRQIEHELDLEKTKNQLLEQQNMFQEQQQILQNQRQEIQIERWRMEQEKNQLMHEHEMNIKREQFEQQKVLNQQLEQQRRTFEKQLQNQRQLQEQLQKELEHQKQLQIENQKQLLNNQQNVNQLMNSAMSKQQHLFDNQPQNPYFNDSQILQSPLQNSSQNLSNLPFSSSSLHPHLLQQQQQQQQQPVNKQMSSILNNKKSPLQSPLQSLQSLLPQSLKPKSLQNQSLNEPTKPRRHRLGQDDLSHQYSAFKPPLHNNSNLNLMTSPKSSFNAINQLTTPYISTEKRPLHNNSNGRPSSPMPMQSSFTSNPGMLSSTSSLTRQQPVGLMMNSLAPNQQSQFSNRSQENLNRSRQNFLRLNEFDQTNNKSNQYFGSGGNLSKTEMNFNNSDFTTNNYNNKNLSTGSLHLTQQQDNRLISGQRSPNSRSQFRTGNYQQDQFDQRQYSSHTNLHPNQHSNLNGPRRNSVMDPFRDHFDQYFTPKKQTSTTNLKPTTVVHKVSNTDLNATTNNQISTLNTPNIIVNSTVQNSINNQQSNLNKSLNIGQNPINQQQSNLNKSLNIGQNPINQQQNLNQSLNLGQNKTTELRNQTKNNLLDPLDKLNENKNNLIEYQGMGNRRLTLPELPRLETTSNEQIKGYSIGKTGQSKGDSMISTVNRRKNSLPDNVKSAAAVIQPGWAREEVSVLAHEAREAKAKAIEMNATQVTILKIKELFLSNLFVISLIVFNLSIFYVYLQLLEPLD